MDMWNSDGIKQGKRHVSVDELALAPARQRGPVGLDHRIESKLIAQIAESYSRLTSKRCKKSSWPQ
jgi:hypothetical protein